MASVNKVIIIGNLGNDPEIRKLPSGDSVANISVATTDRYRDKQTGENKEITEWHRVSFFGRTAEVVGQYLRKGSSVYVEGSLRTRKWQDQSGQTRYSTEIRGDVMQMLGGKSGATAGSYTPAPQQQAPAAGSYGQQAPVQAAPTQAQPTAPAYSTGFEDMGDDIPF